MKRQLSCVVTVAALAASAFGQLIVPGANDGSPGCGSDGEFHPLTSVEIDLRQAANRVWSDPSPVQGNGVYDYEKWAVVFKYTSVTIPAGVTVTFKNHTSGAPVVWLVGGDVTIDGTVSLNGADHDDQGRFALGGAGGFRGGRGYVGATQGSAGSGPGGGKFANGDCGGRGTGGSYGTFGRVPCGNGTVYAPTYGNSAAFPLIGGSGGSGCFYVWEWGAYSGGGAGGGAILVACAGTVVVNGTVRANGGLGQSGGGQNYSGAGAGGAVRLIANELLGNGAVQATGGASYNFGGSGRIRLEANNFDQFTGSTVPPASGDLPGAVALIFPDDAAPRIYVTQVGGQDVPGDPRPLRYPLHDVQVPITGQVVVQVDAYNMPVDPPNAWIVKVRVVPFSGTDTSYQATMLFGGTVEHSTWEATVNLPSGSSAIQVRAALP